MSKLFPKHIIDIEKGTVYSKKYKIFIGYLTKKGYMDCRIKDVYGNKYRGIHQVILAEALQLPKHKWPVDENGFRFEPDHINTINSDNRIENLRLVSKKDNMNNELTKAKTSNTLMGHPVSEESKTKNSLSHKGRHLSPDTEFKKGCESFNRIPVDLISLIDGTVIKKWHSATRAEEEGGFNRHCIYNCCKGKQKQHKGFTFRSYKQFG